MLTLQAPFIVRLTALLALGAGQSLFAQAKSEVLVAAASNLTDVFRVIGPQFERDTGIHPTFSFGSTAVLTQQAERGAPFDLIAAADVEHIAQLETKGLLLKHSQAIYAYGTLALWVPGKLPAVSALSDLVKPEVKVISIAKPQLAPYGAAALSALKNAGIWDRVSSKIVYAENITVAKQYGASGNADAVLTAYPLVLNESGTVATVDPKLYAPIAQGLGVLASAPHRAAAERFADYILNGPGSLVLQRYGYKLPKR